MKEMSKIAVSLIGVFATVGSAFAAGSSPDYSALTAAIDFSAVNTAVLAAGGLLMGVYVVIKGVKTIIRMVKGG